MEDQTPPKTIVDPSPAAPIEPTPSTPTPNKIKRILLIVTALIMVPIILLGGKYFLDDQKAKSVTDFASCQKAGYPVLKTYPGQCSTPDGRKFVQVLTEKEKQSLKPPTDEAASSKTIILKDANISFLLPTSLGTIKESDHQGIQGGNKYIVVVEKEIAVRNGGKSLQYIVRIESTSVDFQEPRKSSFMDLMGFKKDDRGEYYYGVSVSGGVELLSPMITPAKNTNGVEAIVVAGGIPPSPPVNWDLTTSSVPDGYIGVLVNTKSKTYPGVALIVDSSNVSISTLNQIISSFKFTGSNGTDSTTNTSPDGSYTVTETQLADYNTISITNAKGIVITSDLVKDNSDAIGYNIKFKCFCATYFKAWISNSTFTIKIGNGGGEEYEYLVDASTGKVKEQTFKRIK